MQSHPKRSIIFFLKIQTIILYISIDMAAAYAYSICYICVAARTWNVMHNELKLIRVTYLAVPLLRMKILINGSKARSSKLNTNMKIALQEFNAFDHAVSVLQEFRVHIDVRIHSYVHFH